MNRKHTLPVEREETNVDGAYAVHRSWVVNIVALAVCLVLAFLIWIVVMNTENTEEIELRVLAPQEGYTYTLSAERLKVRGKTVDLKAAKSIGVCIPGHASGTYVLAEEDLVLPEGVHLTAPLTVTITVYPQA